MQHSKRTYRSPKLSDFFRVEVHSAGVRVRLGARGAKRKNTPHHADCLSFARAGDCGPDRERNSSDFRDILKRFPQAGETRLAKPAARLNYATSPLRENSMLHSKTAVSAGWAGAACVFFEVETKCTGYMTYFYLLLTRQKSIVQPS